MWRHVTRPTVAFSRGFSSACPEDMLHRSPLRTDHFQASLPRLPVPKLEDTIARYLSSQSAVLNEDQFSYHRKTVEEFKAGPGPQLHQNLLDFAKANSHTSYITDFWFDMYLRDRRPISFTHTPFVNFNKDEREAYNSVSTRATNMIYSSVRFLRAYREGCLAPEVFHLNPAKSDTPFFRTAVSWCPNRVATYLAYTFKAYPLDMSQFANLFSSTRLPRPEKDEIKSFDGSRHLMVMRNGHIYTFDILDESGRAVSPEQILANVEYILQLPNDEAQNPIGALTSLDRDTWTKMREHLLQIGNADVLQTVDSAIFVVSLDDCNLDDLTKSMRNFLYGLKPNRWFDKSLNLLFDANGDAGLNFEHSWGDGVAVLRYVNEVFQDSTTRPVVHPDTKVPNGITPKVQRLDFKVDEVIKSSIASARQAFDEKSSSLDVVYRACYTFDKNTVKKAKLSPDSVIQLIIQMAYFKMHGEIPPAYESCSTSAFKHGRTETVRSATPETLAFCRRNASGSASPGELAEALLKCSDKHNQLVKEAAMGQGWDRHLFALRKLAEVQGLPTAALFEDYFYTNINHIILSTSTLNSPAIYTGGFAAVTPNGYGIGYGFLDRGLGFVGTAYPDIGGTSLTDFTAAFEDAIEDVHAVLEGRKR